jgi:formate transporter
VLLNWLLAGAGNLVGAVVFVSTSYWYLFLRDEPAEQPSRTPVGGEAAERA